MDVGRIGAKPLATTAVDSKANNVLVNLILVQYTKRKSAEPVGLGDCRS
jgi:hypothetical protein